MQYFCMKAISTVENAVGTVGRPLRYFQGEDVIRYVFSFVHVVKIHRLGNPFLVYGYARSAISVPQHAHAQPTGECSTMFRWCASRHCEIPKNDKV